LFCFISSGPGYPGADSLGTVCTIAGSVPGQSFVDGDAYINGTYAYMHSHKWRNFGIILGQFILPCSETAMVLTSSALHPVFLVGLMVLYLAASEFITGSKSKGELKLYPRGRLPKVFPAEEHDDVESGTGAPSRPSNAQEQEAKEIKIQKQTAIFHFEDLCYDIPVKGGTRRLLDHVDGWVKPGTLTALMGVSG